MTDNSKGDILAVDDTPASLKLLTDLLKAEGYRVRSAINGQLALQAAASAPPELILLDINMPGMNGFEVCQRIRAKPETADIPIIFISALQETAEKVKGFELGAVDYVTKPYQREELLARVRTHLELHRLHCHFEKMVDLRTAELRKAEAELAHSNRDLRAMSKCNKILVRVAAERALLDEFCRAVCEEAGYRAAWVGYTKNGTADGIRPVASAGLEVRFLPALCAAWAQKNQEPDSAAVTFQNGKPFYIQELAKQGGSLWEDALQRGYRACVCLPLRDENANIFGIFSALSEEAGIFTPGELRLLEELAGDLAFGVRTLRVREERDRVEAEIGPSTSISNSGLPSVQPRSKPPIRNWNLSPIPFPTICAHPCGR